MSFAIARGNWHGLSLEDAVLGVAGLVFAYVLTRLFGHSIARDNGAHTSVRLPFNHSDDAGDDGRRPG
jgi:hypothetical protein